LNAVSSLQLTNVSTPSDGGGLFSSADAHSNADLEGTTQAVVGSNASIQAQTISILADLTGAQGNLNSSATADGLCGGTTADTKGTWDPSTPARPGVEQQAKSGLTHSPSAS